MTTQPTGPATSFSAVDDLTLPQLNRARVAVSVNETRTMRQLFLGVIAVVAMGIVSRVASGIITDFPGRDLVVPMLMVVAVIVLFVPFLRALPRWTAGGMILAGALYVLGVVGLEIIEGILEFEGRFYSLAISILVTTEEFLEMFSVVLFIGVLLDSLRRQLPNLHLDLGFLRAHPR